MTEIHKLIDEKIGDVYERNKLFLNLLEEYYINPSQSIRDQLWKIILQCSANFLKKKMGTVWSYQQIEDLSMEMTIALMGRIENKIKYPKGYRIVNLPKTVEYVFLTCFYGPKCVKEREVNNKSISWELIENKILEEDEWNDETFELD